MQDITEETDRNIYRILAALQSKDSRCYDPNYKFFNDKCRHFMYHNYYNNGSDYY